jgi:cytochrome c oxidase assembly protein subunit 15
VNSLQTVSRAFQAVGRAILQRLPSSTTQRRVRFIAWASLVSQTLIVGTGGAVRLTGSGLGCPTWPRCTAESFVSTPEMGIHGIIEFGNRLLTVALVIIAIVAFAFVVRMRHERPELMRLAILLGLGIPAQAVLGGITVLTNLNPWIVGLHFVVSAVLVAFATVFVYRVYRGRTLRQLIVPPPVRYLGLFAAASAWVTVLVGIVVTGSGPHAGDDGAARNGLDSELWQHLHSWPAYIVFGLSLLLLVAAVRLGLPALRRATVALVAIEVVQIAVGITQARLGLPIILVGVHMVLACVFIALMTLVLLTMRETEGSLARTMARSGAQSNPEGERQMATAGQR